MKSMLSSREWGCTDEGQPVHLYTLQLPGGLSCSVMDHGATITSLKVPSESGPVELALGFDSLAEYMSAAYKQANPFFGATIGRFANRIARGELPIGTTVHQLSQNEHGNCLHGGFRGFDKRLWQSSVIGSDKVRMRLISPDGEEGFPGTLQATVTFSLALPEPGNGSAFGDLVIEYMLESDAPTVANVTNHTYFNLAGSGSALDHLVHIASESCLELDSQAIPTGSILPVRGTSLDFSRAISIRRAVEKPGNTKAINGYAHTFLLSPLERTEPLPAAWMQDPHSGRTMEVLTTEPGVLIYGGEGLDGSLSDRRGGRLERGSGICLETQRFPDAPHHRHLPQCYLEPHQPRYSTTIYRFRLDS